MSKRIQRKEGRRTCGSKDKVSVFDFSKPEQRTILLFGCGCFQYHWENADGFGVFKETRETAGKTVSKEPR